MIAGTLVFFPPDWPLALARSGRDGTWSRRRRRPPRPRRGAARPVGRRRPRRVGGRPAGDPAAPPRLPRRRALDRGGLLRVVPGDAHREDRVAARSRSPTRRRGRRGRSSRRPCSTDWQERQAVARADLTLAAAHLVADEHCARRGIADVEVRADSFVSFNGRRRQRMIDPTVDLAALSPACAGVGVRPAARSADTDDVMPSARGTSIGVAARRADRRRRGRRRRRRPRRAATTSRSPSSWTSDAPTFASLDELVAASDVVVVGTVADVADGRTC